MSVNGVVPSCNPDLRTRSAKIASDVERFLAAGGKIDYCTEPRSLDTVTTYNGRARNGAHASRGGNATAKPKVIAKKDAAGYLSTNDIVKRPGSENYILPVSRSELHRQVERGKFPQPDAVLGKSWLWKRETIDALIPRFAGRAK